VTDRLPHLPAVVCRLLDLIQQDAIVGDLLEEYATHILPHRGPVRARIWLWRHVVGSTALGLTHLAVDRLRSRTLVHNSTYPKRGTPQREIMGTFIRDFGYGLRMLVKTPALSLVAILTIALGVGLTTHTFSVVYGSVIRGLPFDGGDRLMSITESKPAEGITGNWVPIHDYVDWRDQQTAFNDLAGLYEGTVNLADEDRQPDRFLGAFVTANMMDVVGVAPILGRAFQPGEDQPSATPTIVLGYDVWQNRYGGDPAILGRGVRANGKTHTIIGVMPPRFRFPFQADLWMPLGMDASQLKRGEGHHLNIVGKLAPGVSIDQAATQLASVAQRIAETYPETNEGVTAAVHPFTEEYMPPEIIAVLWAMLVAVFGVLLIACANVANLLLARATVRSKEVAIRSALGASRSRVIRQLLVESLVLALLGGGLGIALSYVGIDIFNAAILDIQKPFWIMIDLNNTVLLFALGVTLVASIVSGTIPAFKASGADVHELLKDEGRGSSSFRMSRFSAVLVVVEIALSCALLIAAGFMVKSIIKVKTLDMGFSAENVFTARLGLFESDYPDGDRRLVFLDQLEARLRGLPAARTVSLTSSLPASGADASWITVAGETYVADRDYPVSRWSVISPDFFETFEIDVTDGRKFDVRDRADNTPVAIVNESFARRHFGTESAIDRRFRLGRSDSEEPWLTIVGVVPDMHIGGGVGGIGSDRRTRDQFFVPLAQNPLRFVSIAVKTAGPPMAIAADVRRVVTSLDPNLPIYNVDSMDGVIETNTWAFGLFGSLFAIFGGIALFMAAVGLYGVMAFSVNLRTQELGIRMALGAHGGDIIRLILRSGLTQLAIGLGVGVAIGAALSNPLRVMLFDVRLGDPTVYLTIIVTLTVTGLLACLVPARRATRVDVVHALKPD
jgi:putative ABC transport system permease protein